MFNVFADAPPAPDVRGAFNIGCLLDIPTAEVVIGNRGESIYMGGKPYTFSVTGPQNAFKTDLGLYPMMVCLNRYPSHRGVAYDTENSLKYQRFDRIAASMERLRDVDFKAEAFKEDPLLLLVQKADIPGEQFFELVKAAKATKLKNKQKLMRTLPIRNANGELMKQMAPTHVLMDTLTQFSISTVDAKLGEKTKVGDKEANMVFMDDGKAKTQLVMQLPDITVQAEIYFSMTAHIGQRFEMDPYAPKPITLTFSKNGTKPKGVPEKFSQINEHLIEVITTKPLVDKDKAPLYPSVAEDREKSNDLFVILAVNSRNKGGPSGVDFPIIVSQNEGIKPGLTHYGYIKENGKFGIGGNNTTYHISLYPKCNLMRTTIRKKIDDDYRLQRALEITADMLQMRKTWRATGEKHCTPEELYNDIVEKGYDWDILLDSRGYWMFHEDEADQRPFLSTMDLLNMRMGTYHPYWLKDDKKTIIEKHWNVGAWKDKV